MAAPLPEQLETSALRQDLPRPLPGNRWLPARLGEVEPWWKRRLFELIAVAVAGAYLFFVLSYWAPAHPGVDQNGYLVGGKQLALTGSTGFKPANPFLYVGAMWIMTGDPDTEVWYYPKYPIGLPLLDAIPLWIDWNQGKIWAMYLSPVCTALSLLAMFLMVRLVANSFLGVLSMLLLGVNFMTLSLVNNPNSHAPALAFVAWGMYVFLRWWQSGAIWRGLLAGFLLGFAVTIRYTEGLLIAPLLLAAATSVRYRQITRASWWRAGVCLAVAAGATWVRLRSQNSMLVMLAIVTGLVTLAAILPWRQRRMLHRSREFWRSLLAAGLVGGAIGICVPAALENAYDRHALILLALTLAGLIVFLYAPPDWRRAGVPLVGWMVPILWLVGFNWFAMGSITGYDTTNESTGFTMEEFWKKWEFTVQQMYDVGAFFLLPLALLGLVGMFRQSWRLGMTIVLWLVPSALLYAAYYWGLELVGMSYLRFFLTLLPAIVLAAMWLVYHGGWARVDAVVGRGAIAMPIACGLFVAVPTTLALRNSLPVLAREQTTSLNLNYTCENIESRVPAGSVVFADQGRGPAGVLNFLQWRGDYDLYAGDAFATGGRRWRGGVGAVDRPNPRQPLRNQYLREHVYQQMTDAELIAEQNKLISTALKSGRRVFLVMPSNWPTILRNRFGLGVQFDLRQVAQWTEPVALTALPERTRLMPEQRFNAARGPQSWQILEVKPRLIPSSLPVAGTR